MKNNINDFVNREGECEYFFSSEGPFWHLCTPGEGQPIIFRSQEDYQFAVTSSALALREVNASGKRVKIYAFAIMSNHIHELLSGAEEDCLEYFSNWKAKIFRYFNYKIDLSLFVGRLIPVPSLKVLRNEIAYIHRNGFAHNRKETPFSYEWSTGKYYFCPSAKQFPTQEVSSMSHRQKRAVLKVTIKDEYNSLSITNGYVSPMSFCEIEAGEFLYRNAHLYFYKISRDVESYSLIAKALGDDAFLNDEEMFGLVYRKLKELYKVDSVDSLSKSAKIDLARIMHNEYRASNGQIQRMLKLEREVVEELFPRAV